MGHIKLAAPVTHIWFLKGIPSYLGLILDMSLKDLEQVIYFNSYVVLDPGNTELKANQLLSEEEYESILEENEEAQLEVGIGAEAMQILLNRLNLQEMSDNSSKSWKKSLVPVKNALSRSSGCVWWNR